MLREMEEEDGCLCKCVDEIESRRTIAKNVPAMPSIVTAAAATCVVSDSRPYLRGERQPPLL